MSRIPAWVAEELQKLEKLTAIASIMNRPSELRPFAVGTSIQLRPGSRVKIAPTRRRQVRR